MKQVNLGNIKERLKDIHKSLEKDVKVEKNHYLELMNLYQCIKDLESEQDKLDNLAEIIRGVL